MSLKQHRGFSLLELLATVAIGFTVACIGFISLLPTLKQSRVDNAYDTTLATIRTYRNRAVTERKRYILTFTVPGTITVQRWDFAVPISPPPVTVATFTLPTDVQYAVQAGFPTTAATVPDGFGAGGTALDFGQGLGAGSLNYIMFMPDGSSQDTLGNQNSGVLYITRPNELYSSRSITVFGTTGRIRGYRLYNEAGTPTWVQQ